MIYTVFPNNENEMPQDFQNYIEAEKYGDELDCDYVIATNDGEIVWKENK